MSEAQKQMEKLETEAVVDYFSTVEKRTGEKVGFDIKKIRNAIFLAARSVGGEDMTRAEALAHQVCRHLRVRRGEHVPKVEEIQDAVETILVKNGHDQTAKAFILYREKRARQRRTTNRDNLRQALTGGTEATDLALFVQTTGETIAGWDRTRISRALVRETELDAAEAEKIALEVEGVVANSGLKEVTSSLIRELVNSKLIERGLLQHYKRHARLGVPAYDIERMMLFRNRENANVPHNPEATNMTLAEGTLKQFALSMVFDDDVAEAHARGDIHLHDLGFINRPYCSGQSLEYVKKFGLSLPNALSMAHPAKHPETLLAHMVKFSAALQGHFAGAIGWDAVNLFFAPFTEGMNDHDLHQLAQMLIFEYSQQNVARGGQAIFSDINLYWEVPQHFAEVEAVGPGGEYTGRKYHEYLKEAQRFVWAIFDVYKEGDAKGRPFFFPKPLVHLTDRFLATPGWQDFLWHIADVAAEKGNTYFVFDRGNTAKISECCRLSFKLEQSDLCDAYTPWKMRYCALQNVTLNLPRAAYVANHNDEKLFEQLRSDLELAVKAHVQKKEFIGKLLKLKDNGPLALLTMEQDGEPYLRMKRVTYLVGVLGLNELVQYHLGKELHEADAAFRFGLKVMAFLNLECRRLSRQYDMRFVLEQTPAESTAYRLARLDLAHFHDSALRVVKGNLADGSAYYTNSTYLNVGYAVDPIDRVYREGKFHDMIEAGALTHVWLADARPPKEGIADFVLKTYHHTRNSQIAFSPEFTTCKNCQRTSRGLNDVCPFCGKTNVDFITRVTGYFSRVSSWNVGKRAELLDRYKGGFPPVG
ncbi:anaerobic ribonucleoside-triphosphate reductase [candidate division WOR-3 bacterium]|nr:anaerobic ribonucleoside-triphosphate reductase [candidate division WOR-3 bacterium]